MKVSFYQSSSGASPVEKYVDELSEEEQATFFSTLALIEHHGINKNTVHFRPIEGKLWEIKLRKHRYFYVLITGPLMVLLHAYKKESQKAPKRELDVAKHRMSEILKKYGS